jgi:A/G-specific adenine glycosylase
MDTLSHSQFIKIVEDYYTLHGRNTLPWRVTRNPYHILVSEIMLQQTQVPRVIEKYTSWIHTFPTPFSVAEASLQDILFEWKGLGYNRRAVALKKLCEIVTENYDSHIPQDIHILLSLPGIGPYTARAIRTFSWNAPEVFIETNIRSVFIYHFFPMDNIVSDKDIIPLIEATVDKENPREWYYALMDYGSYIKKTVNPSRKSKHHVQQSQFKGSNREQRSLILNTLLESHNFSKKGLTDKEIRANLENILGERLSNETSTSHHFANINKNISTLVKEGFIQEKNGRFSIQS